MGEPTGREGVKPASRGSLMSYLTAWDSRWVGQWAGSGWPEVFTHLALPWLHPQATPLVCERSKGHNQELQTPTGWSSVPSPLARGPRFP